MSYTYNDDAISITDLNGNQVAVSQSQQISASNQPALMIAGSSSTGATLFKTFPDGTVFITGSVTTGITIPLTQSITGTIHVDNTFLSVSINNFPVTQSVKIDQSILLPISISNFPTIQNVSQGTSGSIPWKFVVNDGTTTFGVASANPLWVTGSITQNNFPVTQSIKIADIGTNITQSVTGTMTVLNTVNITGSVYQINQPVTQSVKIDQSITVPVSISNQILTQSVTGTIHIDNALLPISVSNFPVSQTVIQGTSGSLPWKFVVNDGITTFGTSSTNPLWITGSTTANITFPITQAVSLVNVGTNVTQSITGTVHIDNSLFSVSISNSPTVVQGNSGSLPWKFVVNDGTTTFGTNTTNPLWITGSTTIVNNNTTQSVYLSNIANNLTQSIIGNVSASQAGTWRFKIDGYEYSGYSPDPSSYPVTNQTSVTIDTLGRIETHSTVTSDEGSFRDDFSGTSISSSLAGTVTFTNSSVTVVGSGTSFASTVKTDQYVKRTVDNESNWTSINTVGSDTSIVLNDVYPGTTGTGAVISNWDTTTATGGSITVANSLCNLASGTTNGQNTNIQRFADYLPFAFSAKFSISQRIANQTIIVGLQDVFGIIGTPSKQATVQFSGTDNTKATFVTCNNTASTDAEQTTITIPNSGTTNTLHVYKIDISGAQCALIIDGVTVAIHNTHIIGPYDPVNMVSGIINTGVPASSTTLSLDYVYFYNMDRVQIDDDFSAEPLIVGGGLSNGSLISGSINPILIGGSDGTNIKTIATDVSGNVRNTTYPSIATYAGTTNGSVATGTAAATTTSIAYLWHAATNTKRVEIYRITFSAGGGAGGNFLVRGSFITAENGTPAGIIEPVNPLDRNDAVTTITGSTGTFRVAATGAPTRLVGDIITENFGGATTSGQYVLFDTSVSGKPIVLRSGSAEGFEIRTVVGTALTTASTTTTTFFWTEG